MHPSLHFLHHLRWGERETTGYEARERQQVTSPSTGVGFRVSGRARDIRFRGGRGRLASHALFPASPAPTTTTCHCVTGEPETPQPHAVFRCGRGLLASLAPFPALPGFRRRFYRGTSLIRNVLFLGPYSRPMPGALRWLYGRERPSCIPRPFPAFPTLGFGGWDLRFRGKR